MASGNDLRNNIGKFANTVILICMTDVERLVVNSLLRRIQDGENGCDNVAYMHDWAPRRPITLYVNSTGGVRRGHQIIQNDVKPQAWGHAIGGRIAHVGGTELFICQWGNVALH